MNAITRHRLKVETHTGKPAKHSHVATPRHGLGGWCKWSEVKELLAKIDSLNNMLEAMAKRPKEAKNERI